MAKKLVPSDLTAREQKVLRYLVTCSTPPVTPARCIVQIPWSDLPKTLLQARSALEQLRRLGLADRVEGGYTPTEAGQRLVEQI